MWADICKFAVEILAGFWENLAEMAPYLLFGFLMAGVLSVLVPPSIVERHLGGRGIWPVVKASAFGVPLPLCSCGVIPVSASLRRHGASRGATTAFLLSTPQTGVDSIMVTLSLLGPVFAIFRPLAALATGVFGGSLVTLLGRNGEATDPAPAGCEEACCAGDGSQSKLAGIFSYGFVALPRDIGKALLLGLVLAGLIAAAVPKDVAGAVGTGILGMLVMMVVGVPLYVCATASVPIAAALVAKGVSPGAALVFLMTGPATNAATIMIVWKVMGRRTAGVYLGAVAFSALACGILLDFIYKSTGASAAAHLHTMLPLSVKIACAIVLLSVLGVAIFWRPKGRAESHEAPKEEEMVELTVKGMTCSHCVQAVTRALSECVGVVSADVDLKTSRALVRGRNLDTAALRRAVEELGYAASTADEPHGDTSYDDE